MQIPYFFFVTFLKKIEYIEKILYNHPDIFLFFSMETPKFLDNDKALKISEEYGTPVFVYSEQKLREQAKKVLSINVPYGLTVRYAMKANPLKKVLQIFDSEGIHIDASSGYEAKRAIIAGIDPKKIMVTAQELPKEFYKDVLFNASSLYQLEEYGKSFRGTKISIRINPGIGSGIPKKTIVGGANSSFGIWYEHIPEIKRILNKYSLSLDKIHTHIGSGTNPSIWNQVASLSLSFVKQFETVKTINLGGGFKIGRMSYEKSTYMEETGEAVTEALLDFYNKTKRAIHLEIEPGTFLTANTGTLITTIQDTCETSNNKFLKIDAGMTEILRPCLYGAKHPLIVVPKVKDTNQSDRYIVVGHCCETSDTITPQEHDGEKMEPRLLKKAKRGDLLLIEGVGAYCSSMCASNYNSFPQSAEVLITQNNETVLIKKREKLEDILSLEV